MCEIMSLTKLGCHAKSSHEKYWKSIDIVERTKKKENILTVFSIIQ